MTTLFVAAAPAEAQAILAVCGADESLAARQWIPHTLSEHVRLLITGIGKANAAGALAHAAAVSPPERIINLGIAGALPGSGLVIGDAVTGARSIFADEGLVTADGFIDCAAMGFPLIPPPGPSGPAFPADPDLLALLSPLARTKGGIATVSTCSGTDQSAAQVAQRTGALAECMEGAALAQTASRLDIPFAELRIISNTTGNRARQQWDLPLALAALTAVTGRLVDLLAGAGRA